MRNIELVTSTFYEPGNYDLMGAHVTQRVGTIGILETNELFMKENLHLSSKPDGYIICVGNGAIWLMLDLFQNGTQPKGIISLDRDASVILSGKVLLELAKQEITSDKAVEYFYGGKIDDMVAIAKNIIQNEENDAIKQALMDTISTGQFIRDLEVLHQLEINPTVPDVRRRKSISSAISKHWPTIIRLAKEGKIHFLHSDISNEATLRFITANLPDIPLFQNILYISNVVDKRYKNALHEWEIFNPTGLSWYIFTSAQDDYMLKASHQPPVYQI